MGGKKKIRICTKVTPETSKLLQLMGFELGFKWICFDPIEPRYCETEFLYISETSFLKDDYHNYNYTKVSNEDFLKIMQGKLDPPAPKEVVKLSVAGYNCEVVANEYVKVGCTTLTKNDVDLLIKHYQGEK